MMNFFEPNDFLRDGIGTSNSGILVSRAVVLANQALSQRAFPVFGYGTTHKDVFRFYQTQEHPLVGTAPEIEAFIIDIKPVQKCDHPIEKISIDPQWVYSGAPKIVYFCKCGAKVVPEKFKGAE